jgi:hypothetical protein
MRQSTLGLVVALALLAAACGGGGKASDGQRLNATRTYDPAHGPTADETVRAVMRKSCADISLAEVRLTLVKKADGAEKADRSTKVRSCDPYR